MVDVPVKLTEEERRIVRTYGEISPAAALKIIHRNGWTTETCESFLGVHEYHRTNTQAYFYYRKRVENKAADLLSRVIARYLEE